MYVLLSRRSKQAPLWTSAFPRCSSSTQRTKLWRQVATYGSCQLKPLSLPSPCFPSFWFLMRWYFPPPQPDGTLNLDSDEGEEPSPEALVRYLSMRRHTVGVADPRWVSGQQPSLTPGQRIVTSHSVSTMARFLLYCIPRGDRIQWPSGQMICCNLCM